MNNLNTNKKSIMRFTIVVLISAIVGASVSYFSKYLNKFTSSISQEELFSVLFYIGLILIFILAIISIGLTIKVKTALKNVTDLSEYSVDCSTNEKLSLAISINSINTVISLSWLVCLVCIPTNPSVTESLVETENLLIKIFIALVVVIFLVIYELYPFSIYNRIYTTKKIDVFSFKSSSELFEKLDEGEKWIVLLASYKVFRLMDILVISLMLISMFISIIFGINVVFTILVLAFILIFSKIVYYTTSRKLEKISD